MMEKKRRKDSPPVAFTLGDKITIGEVELEQYGKKHRLIRRSKKPDESIWEDVKQWVEGWDMSNMISVVIGIVVVGVMLILGSLMLQQIRLAQEVNGNMNVTAELNVTEEVTTDESDVYEAYNISEDVNQETSIYKKIEFNDTDIFSIEELEVIDLNTI